MRSNPLHPPFPDVIIAHSEGRIEVYPSSCCGAFTEFPADYGADDHFAVGNLIGGDVVEMVVGDTSADQLKIYAAPPVPAGDTPDYGLEYTVPVTLETDDGMAIGDFRGGVHDEIVVADASENRILVFAYNAFADRFEEVTRFRVSDFHPDDALAVGRLGDANKDQVVLLRGHGEFSRQAGTVEMTSHVRGVSPGDQWSLDRLLNEGGTWASAMAPAFVEDGYLLLVGELEVLPTFSRTWDLTGVDVGHVDYTDRNYGSTDSWTDNSRPEIAVGRISGNEGDLILQALANAIEVAMDPWRPTNTGAYCVSGHNRGPDGTSDDIDFVPLRDSIADKLRARGYTVDEQHTPSAATFMDNEAVKGMIFLAGHGWSHGWDVLTRNIVRDEFDPLSSRPVVFAFACLTGRYPEGYTVGEAFLMKRSSVFIGGTENSISCLDWGWGPRFAQAFFDRIELGVPLGKSLRLAKRYRVSDAANTYLWDWNFNHYHCAIFHYFGDPKADIVDFSPGSARNQVRPAVPNRSDTEPVDVVGPIDLLPVTVPRYEIATQPGRPTISIPGQEHAVVPGLPAVPIHATTVSFPSGFQIQGVSLKERGGLIGDSGIILRPAIPQVWGELGPQPEPPDADGWWPDRDFTWSVTEQRDGSTLLTVTAFPFFYNRATTESRFYSDFQFEISAVESEATIHSLKTDRAVYTGGSIVTASVYIRNDTGEPGSFKLEAAIQDRTRGMTHQPFKVQTLDDVGTFGWTTLSWNPGDHRPGTYALDMVLKSIGGVVLDRATAEFDLAPEPMMGPDLVPNQFHVPNDMLVDEGIQLTWQVENRGSEPAPAGGSDAVYLSETVSLNDQQQPIARFPRTQSIDPGAALARSGMLMVSSWPPGPAYLILVVDDDDAVQEADETNNSSHRLVAVRAPESVAPESAVTVDLSGNPDDTDNAGVIVFNKQKDVAGTVAIQWVGGELPAPAPEGFRLVDGSMRVALANLPNGGYRMLVRREYSPDDIRALRMDRARLRVMRRVVVPEQRLVRWLPAGPLDGEPGEIRFAPAPDRAALRSQPLLLGARGHSMNDRYVWAVVDHSGDFAVGGPVSAAPQLRITAISFTVSGRILIEFESLSGIEHGLQSSADLRAWTGEPFYPDETATSSVNTIVGTGKEISVFVEPTGRSRFYRVSIR